MFEIFRTEAESQIAALIAALLSLEREPAGADCLEAAMRGAHSLKGAARILELGAGVKIAHAMEDCFVAAQTGRLQLNHERIDLLLRCVDLLARIARTPEAELVAWETSKAGEVDALTDDVARILATGKSELAEPAARPAVESPVRPVAAMSIESGAGSARLQAGPAAPREEEDRVLRVTAVNLNRILGLAGESLVESRRLRPFAEGLSRLKRYHTDLTHMLDSLRGSLTSQAVDEQTQAQLLAAQSKLTECRQLLSNRLLELDVFDQRSANLSHRLYSEALSCRMRPFGDGVQAFPRMVRDLARSLGKEVRLEICGQDTDVDRELLEKLEAPLTHLLRNAADHAFEEPDERRRLGKKEEGTLRLEARHFGGQLHISVTDDGRGIDLEMLRHVVVERKLTSAETAGQLSDGELSDFLFLPGFSLKETVTELSGRGVGLDIVQTVMKSVRGSVSVTTKAGQGTTFNIQLPLTLSLLQALLVEIGGEAYAFPLAGVVRVVKLPCPGIESLEGRQHFLFEGRHVGLVTAHQVLQTGKAMPPGEEISLIVIGDRHQTYALAVDKLLGERELVVQPLDSRLGKIKDIAAGALMEDGCPVLIVDVEDLIRSVENLIAAGSLSKVSLEEASAAGRERKRVLVVDDSLTVRELERKLLESHGFRVEVAVDGMDGWNAVRTGHFDLVISDVDMPRMDGIELVNLIRHDIHHRSLPVMIVSYKEREEDRRRGLEAGADYYLTKSSFHDETLFQAVVDLIGEPNP